MATSVTGKATEFIQFTRASNATVTDSDGKIKWAPHNLLTNSENFDAAAWTKLNTTVSANSSSAPNSTTTGDTLTSTSSASATTGVYVNTGALAAGHTLSVFVKAGTSSIAWVSGDNAQSYGVFNLSGAGSVIASANGTASIAQIAGGWFIITVANTTVSNNFFIVGGKDSYTSGHPWANGTWTSGNTIFIWGAHLYRSDLGGMQANTSAYPMYNPTTPKNLLGYTEDFSNAAWVRANIAAFGSGSVANVILAPNGLQTADLIVENTATSLHSVYQTFSSIANTPYVFSAYVKPAGRTIVRLSPQGTATLHIVEFNLTGAGTATTRSGSGTAAITALSDGWYRISTIVTATASGTGYWQLDLSNAPNSANYTGDGVSGVYIWGAQLSDSASLDTYSPVYGAAVTSAAYYGPRRDFDPVTLACKGLLVEEQRTNSLLHSAAFDNASWVKSNTTVTANTLTAPDGTASADTVSDGTATGFHHINQSVTTSVSTSYTITAYLKNIDRRYVTLAAYSTVTSLLFAAATFDLQSGTVANTGASGAGYAVTASSISLAANGFYRCSVSFTNGSASPASVVAIAGSDTGSVGTSYGIVSYTGSDKSFAVYGAQLEAGSFATSYIPVGATTAGATRNGDVASVSTQAFPYNSTDGTWVANFQTIFSGVTAGSYYVLNLDGSASKRVLYIGSGAEAIASFDGTTVVGTGTDITGPISKSANAYTSSERAVVSNGLTVITGASVASYATASTVNIGNVGNISGVGPLNGHIRQITYLPRRISNTELQTRTS